MQSKNVVIAVISSKGDSFFVRDVVEITARDKNITIKSVHDGKYTWDLIPRDRNIDIQRMF